MTIHNNFSNIYLDNNGRWRDKYTHKMVLNPFIKRCEMEGCDKRVRSKVHNFCPQHLDWTKIAHGSSILTDTDIVFIADNYQQLNDKEIAARLVLELHHKDHTQKSLLWAIRHHRRKYLIYRYSKKFYYKTIKKKYGEQHPCCEICLWHDGSIDIHHILQIKDFANEAEYHIDDNMISLCPNHHRVVEEMRKENMSRYIDYIRQFKKVI
jgi:hypothetical protein